MTSLLMREATCIISKRSESDLNITKETFNQIQEALKENESKLSKIEDKMEAWFKTLSEEISSHQKKVGT
jgi:septation ring formation regulator EzrA